ncbi:MAG TPA: AAA family ATPase [Candidatus Saccharimonadales bacterium]|nr:AAA family ATPase [Candidatus Saccharimonadales bacterium]
MTVDQIYHIIATKKPPVIYISGKTSTGKSTFGRRLSDNLGYHVVELEAVLLEIVDDKGWDEQTTFRKVLHDTDETEERKAFLEITDELIKNALAQGVPLVIEGAVAHVDTLARVLKPARHMLFLYFHPTDIDFYVRNLTKRFLESGPDSLGGLPLKFWKLVDKDEFKEFCQTRQVSTGLEKSIREYAQKSQKESLVRLDEFSEKFGDITMVEVR